MYQKFFKFIVLFLTFFQGVLVAFATDLNVALYPYVPRVEQFKSVISQKWKEIEPNVNIVWIEKWDGGYKDEPKDNYDIFVFDATYLSYFKSQGWLMELNSSDIEGKDDFLSFAINGVKKDGKYWAIPQLGCTEYLIYNKNDKILSEARTLSAIKLALNQCTFNGEIPPKGVGLMCDFSGGTTNAIYYVKTLEEILNKFPIKLPSSSSKIDSRAMNNLRTIISLSSLKNAWYSSDKEYQRGDWYGDGFGRAYIGFSESLSQIPANKLSNIAMRVMPWSDNPNGIQNPLFYADVIAINSKTSNKKLAIKLANLMASKDIIVDSFKARNTSESAQYLTPLRKSVFKELAKLYPTYKVIQNAIKDSGNPILFNLGVNAKEWFSSMKDTIKNQVIDDLKCYCDKVAGEGMDNNKAQKVCPIVCGNNWNGQWTNIQNQSVCGCFCGLHKSF